MLELPRQSRWIPLCARLLGGSGAERVATVIVEEQIGHGLGERARVIRDPAVDAVVDDLHLGVVGPRRRARHHRRPERHRLGDRKAE
jgi:hypothetical protein